MKQTAVEWLEDKYKKLHIPIPKALFDHAKEMEKEQIENAFFQGDLFAVDYFDADKPNEDCNKNYYNKTYNK